MTPTRDKRHAEGHAGADDGEGARPGGGAAAAPGVLPPLRRGHVRVGVVFCFRTSGCPAWSSTGVTTASARRCVCATGGCSGRSSTTCAAARCLRSRSSTRSPRSSCGSRPDGSRSGRTRTGRATPTTRMAPGRIAGRPARSDDTLPRAFARLSCRGLTPKLLRSGSDPHNFHARKARGSRDGAGTARGSAQSARRATRRVRYRAGDFEDALGRRMQPHDRDRPVGLRRIAVVAAVALVRELPEAGALVGIGDVGGVRPQFPPRISTVESGSACRLKYQAGWSSAPPLDAIST